MEFKINECPGDIAEVLCQIINEGNKDYKEKLTNAIYNLKAICENKYNDDGYRILYRTLESVAKNFERWRNPVSWTLR